MNKKETILCIGLACVSIASAAIFVARCDEEPDRSKNLIIHHKESFYQQKFKEYVNGERERSVPLGRIDVETSNVVFEVEFLNKFKEAIGQSKWYSWQTGKRPGIVFVVRKDQAEKCKQVMDTITNKSDIVVFVMDLDGNVLP